MGVVDVFTRISLAIGVIALFGLESSDAQVMGCGGFIRSTKNIDFSRIEVELHTETPSGSFRKVGSTDCSPTNGYYFLPVDNVGTYKLKPVAPRGWKVLPDSIDLKIDGKTDACSKESDLNFEFVGFGITGSVRSKGSGSQKGPKGLTVELSNEKSSKPIQTAETDDNGGYVFFGILPGKYYVNVSEEAQNTFSFKKTSHEIDVGDDVASLEPFYIDGYTLSGKISAKKFAVDLKAVKFALKGMNGELIQKTGSDSSGNYKFQNVAIGDYVVTVESGKNVEIEQQEVGVSVGHRHSQIPEFLVKSFSVSGTVLSSESSKKALGGVKVEAGNFHAVTDKNGVFEFRGLKSDEPFVLKALLDGYDFELSTFDPKNPKNVVYPARYRLSGLVDRQSMPPDFEMKVKFSTKDDEQVGKVLVTENGKFSIYLSAGTYLVSVELRTQTKGIGFAPVHHTVSVVDRPIADINFQPVKADIKGIVQFMVGNEDEVDVTLSSTDGSFGMKKTATSGGTFHFKDVLPGRYTVSVSETGNRCWAKPVQELTVSENIENIVFKQLGYYVNVESFHNTLLIVKSKAKTGSTKEVVIEQGSNAICVETEVEFSTKGCESFEISPKSLVPTKEVQKVTLRPTHYEVSGRVLSKKPVGSLELFVKSEMRNEKLKTIKDSTGCGFSLKAFPGEELTLTPTSEEFLFDPEFVHVYVENSCHLEAVQFEAVSGFFIRGQISPPVADVTVRITNLPSGAATRYATAVTDKDGRYKLGPLPEESNGVKYNIEAKREGYIFKQVQTGNFESKKLAKIIVNVVNSDKKALGGAVISVSGGERFRSNVHTSEKGTAEFLSLSPGEYFVKPQLKEFEFTPKHQLLTIKEGELSDIKFEAKRVAFSAFGQMVSLNGEPESGVTLRAKGIKPESCQGLSEEATSEAKGDFRFRGLVPGCHYSISIRDVGGETLVPEATNIVMEENDMNLKNSITVMRTVEIMDISLRAFDENDPESEIPIKVTMTDHQSYSYSVKRVMGEMVTLPSVDKDKKLYTVTVETFPEKYAPKRKSVIEVYADDYYKFLNVTIKKLTANTSGGSTGSNRKPVSWKAILLLPVFGILLAAFFAKEKVLRVLQNFQDLGTRKVEAAEEPLKGDGFGVVAGTTARKRTKKRLA